MVKGKTVKSIDVNLSWKILKRQYSNKEIAEKLNISRRTALRHRKEISKRFNSKIQNKIIKTDIDLEYRVAELKGILRYRKERGGAWKKAEITSNIQDSKKKIMNEFKGEVQRFIERYGKNNVYIESVNFVEIPQL